ncbi:Hypothetical predicted protein [Cloeon dipterum]|uniref:Uncharacterized protein n=1 Tax=Cloeon dipterum TaxID=197152 RepID=A0A8S1EEU3_9INSE|nr:Hypothetical predicted protein [Cloeon dipterum]
MFVRPTAGPRPRTGRGGADALAARATATDDAATPLGTGDPFDTPATSFDSAERAAGEHGAVSAAAAPARAPPRTRIKTVRAFEGRLGGRAVTRDPGRQAAAPVADGGERSTSITDLRRRHRASLTAPLSRSAQAHRDAGPGPDVRQGLTVRTTLGQAWVTDMIRNPQCAFEMSMFMCPAVHTSTRILRRPSSTHVPSDPPFGVVFHSIASLARSLARALLGYRLAPASLLARGRSLARSAFVLLENRVRHGTEPFVRDCVRALDAPRAVAPTVARRVRPRGAQLARPTSAQVARRILLKPGAAGRKTDDPLTGTATLNGAALPTPPLDERAVARVVARENRRTRVHLSTPSQGAYTVMILPQVHLRKPCYDFYFL